MLTHRLIPSCAHSVCILGAAQGAEKPNAGGRSALRTSLGTAVLRWGPQEHCMWRVCPSVDTCAIRSSLHPACHPYSCTMAQRGAGTVI